MESQGEFSGGFSQIRNPKSAIRNFPPLIILTRPSVFVKLPCEFRSSTATVIAYSGPNVGWAIPGEACRVENVKKYVKTSTLKILMIRS
jgi:hypothetical protein